MFAKYSAKVKSLRARIYSKVFQKYHVAITCLPRGCSCAWALERPLSCWIWVDVGAMGCVLKLRLNWDLSMIQSFQWKWKFSYHSENCSRPLIIQCRNMVIEREKFCCLENIGEVNQCVSRAFQIHLTKPWLIFEGRWGMRFSKKKSQQVYLIFYKF